MIEMIGVGTTVNIQDEDHHVHQSLVLVLGGAWAAPRT
jgi:hypothetical protein